MNTVAKYRFKTQEEFVKEYGFRWRSVRYTFVEDMDFLFGKDYPGEVDENFSDGVHRYSGFSISKEMLIKKLIVPNYKPKKIDRTI